MTGLLASPEPLAGHHDLAILDLDGVVYVGPEAVPGAVEALAVARSRGMARCFVTNNASRTPEMVAEHLSELGVPATADEVLTSAQVAAALLARQLPAGGKVLVVGGAGLELALREAGLQPVAGMDDEPLALVHGFSPTIEWAMQSHDNARKGHRVDLMEARSMLAGQSVSALQPEPGVTR